RPSPMHRGGPAREPPRKWGPPRAGGLSAFRPGATTSRSSATARRSDAASTAEPPAPNTVADMILRADGLGRHGPASVVGAPRSSHGYAVALTPRNASVSRGPRFAPPRIRGRGAPNAGVPTYAEVPGEPERQTAPGRQETPGPFGRVRRS